MSEPYVLCDSVVKIYKVADLEVFALQGLDLAVYPGEMLAIIGNSGSGKSTLLNILGGLDVPSAGRVTVGGRDLGKLTPPQLVQYKREGAGFVWQNNARNLIPYLTAQENVELPMALAGRLDRAWARELLEAVGLGHRKGHRLLELSGGEQQRVAIAIALANRPPLLLADEPTGSVDTATGAQILAIFDQIRQSYGTTVVIVTHDRSLSRAVDRFVAIRDGKVATEAVRRSAVAAAGAPEQETHDEYTLLDSAVRLQLPREFIEQLGIRDRVRVALEDGRIVIRPPE